MTMFTGDWLHELSEEDYLDEVVQILSDWWRHTETCDICDQEVAIPLEREFESLLLEDNPYHLLEDMWDWTWELDETHPDVGNSLAQTLRDIENRS